VELSPAITTALPRLNGDDLGRDPLESARLPVFKFSLLLVMVCLELARLFTEERRAMSKKVLLDPSTGLEDRNASPGRKLHEMAEHCGGNALVIGPTERGVLFTSPVC